MQMLSENLDKLEVLSEIYEDMKRAYGSKEERDIAKLKMQLVKKEMLLLTHMITKELQ
ncbi:MAG: hypothetical protein NDI94_05300 [Candidatus Woesearchaeota archaeon]|nr:hypothetical protein [Candidatus Woesearchaeota archaeon]